jgi:Na+/H+ antiporter NhaC
MTITQSPNPRLEFFGGLAGAVAPFLLFLAGVAALALAGAPDERGFWPVLLAALALGLALARDRTAYAETAIRGMSQPIVGIMILAWLLAGVLAALLHAGSLVPALVGLAQGAGVTGGGFAVAAFLICAVVATATGTSLGTILLCAPLLYPAGGALETAPAVLMGAILGGATFGDNVSPVSDTTIASALTQGAEMGGVVRSRLRYAVPAAAVALVIYGLLGAAGGSRGADAAAAAAAAAAAERFEGLPLLAAPAVALALLLARRHLLVGLMAGIVTAAGLGVALGLLRPAQLLYIDAEHFSARGLIIDGVERGVGISIFTLLLMALVAGLEGAGVLDRLLAGNRRLRTPRGAEWSLFATISAAVLLTTHSVVALLAVGPLARRTGERFGIDPYRRANLLDITVCTYPFLLPYCIPTLLAASLTAGGEAAGMPRLSPWAVGLHNAHSWALLAAVLVAIGTGWGRRHAAAQC